MENKPNTLDQWEAEAKNLVTLADNLQLNRHPDFVKSLEKIKSMGKMNLALIELVRKKDEALNRVREFGINDFQHQDKRAQLGMDTFWSVIKGDVYNGLALTEQLK